MPKPLSIALSKVKDGTTVHDDFGVLCAAWYGLPLSKASSSSITGIAGEPTKVLA